MFRDETGNLDNADTIPFEVEIGRNNFGTDQVKTYMAALVDSENARTASVQYALNGGRFLTLGQITNEVEKLVFKQGGQLIEGRDINYKIAHNDAGSAPAINGITTYYGVSEAIPNETR